MAPSRWRRARADVPARPAFEGADGSRHSLAGLRGKRVMVHFWATWCEPCREALPGLLALAQLDRMIGR
jgi:thiol-disulfide isomerase/thioredoxin